MHAADRVRRTLAAMLARRLRGEDDQMTIGAGCALAIAGEGGG